MDTLKNQLVRRLEDLTPDELRAVHKLIDAFKPPVRPSRPDPEAVRSVRSALAHLPGTLAEVLREERNERV